MISHDTDQRRQLSQSLQADNLVIKQKTFIPLSNNTQQIPPIQKWQGPAKQLNRMSLSIY
jgi:hypothetical protein